MNFGSITFLIIISSLLGGLSITFYKPFFIEVGKKIKRGMSKIKRIVSR